MKAAAAANGTRAAWRRTSPFLNTTPNFPRHRNQAVTKLRLPSTMRDRETVSTLMVFQYPMLSALVENPPVDTAAKAWFTASKGDIPAAQ